MSPPQASGAIALLFLLRIINCLYACIVCSLPVVSYSELYSYVTRWFLVSGGNFPVKIAFHAAVRYHDSFLVTGGIDELDDDLDTIYRLVYIN